MRPSLVKLLSISSRSLLEISQSRFSFISVNIHGLISAPLAEIKSKLVRDVMSGRAGDKYSKPAILATL